MPSSVVHVGFAMVCAVGLLGRFRSPHALAVVALVVLVPEADTLLGWVMPGAHRTVLHTLGTSVLAGGLLYWETGRANSWLRTRWGPAGVRIAWVALFAHTFAHLALDWAHLDGINLLWPLVDQFLLLDGELAVSTSEGLVQTFVDVGVDPETGRSQLAAGQRGSTREVHVANPVQPTAEPVAGPVDRQFPIAWHGWQLYLLLTGLFVVAAKRLQTPRN